MSWELVGGILGAIAAVYTALRVSAIERLKSDLEKEHSRFATTYGRQLDGIVDVYERLVSLEATVRHAFSELTSDDTEANKRILRLLDEFEDVWAYLSRRRLFLPKEIAAKVDQLTYEIQSVVVDDTLGLAPKKTDNEKVMELIRGKVPKIRQELEDEFRAIMGIK